MASRMLRVVAATALLITTSALSAPQLAAEDRSAEIILFNGRITTVDARDTEVEALGIRNGKIIATGSTRKVLKLAGAGTQRIDLGGRRVLPGLIDGHLHGLRLGYHCFSRSVRLDAVFTRKEALAAYAAKATSLPLGTWILTQGGWTPDQFDDDPRMFTRAELDAVAPKHPLYVRYLGYDGALLNSAALRATGISPRSKGIVLENGELTGQALMPTRDAEHPEQAVLTRAGKAVQRQLDAQSIEDQMQCLSDFIAEMNRLGLTSWVDPDGNQQPYNLIEGACRSYAVGLHGHQAVTELYRRRKLNARIAYYVTPAVLGGFETVRADPRVDMTGTGDDMLRLIGMGEDFFCPGNRVQPPEARFEETMAYLAANRASVKIHASGLDTQLFYLKVWEQVNRSFPLAALKWSIAHPAEDGQLPLESLERMKRLGVGMDTSTIASLGVRPSPPFRRIYESGVHWCMSTDGTAGSSYAPFVKLWFAVSGKTLKKDKPGLAPDQQLSRAEALRASTANCAWHMGQEGRLGSLEPGKHADLIVLEEDYFSIPTEKIRDIRPVLTVVDGRIVYEAHGAFLRDPSGRVLRRAASAAPREASRGRK